MRIGITFDLVPAEPDGAGPDDRYEEFDAPETVEAFTMAGHAHSVFPTEVLEVRDGERLTGTEGPIHRTADR